MTIILLKTNPSPHWSHFVHYMQFLYWCGDIILNDSNLKLIERNKFLNAESNQTKKVAQDLQTEINTHLNKIEQNNVNQEELKFLQLNLIHSTKCQKTIFKKGYKVGTQEYKKCILSKGKK